MATIYHPAVQNYTRKAGDTSGIGFYVPIAIPLTGKTVRFQVRDLELDTLILQKISTTAGQITVTDQHVEINLTNADVKLLNATYGYDVECYATDLSTVQTLLTGTITYNKEYSHA